MYQSEFEFLLNQQRKTEESISYNKFNQMTDGVHDSKQLKADKSASLFDFIKMIDRIVSITMKDLKVKFIPDEGKVIHLSNDQPLDTPMITYKLISRKPKGELKPRFRESFVEDKDDRESRFGEIYGQKFECELQFNIFASVYEVAEQVMERFEDMMITYAGYFKKNGVGELLFKQQCTDEAFSKMRQTLSIRNLSYYVEVEKLTVIMEESIKVIDIN